MRTVSKREVDQIAVSGSKVRQLTVTPKPVPPAPEFPDHVPQLANLESRADNTARRVEEVALGSAGELERQRKVIEHLGAQLHDVKHQLAIKRIPPQMQIKRGVQGFIDTVTCGGLVFKFNRRTLGGLPGSVESIDVLTRP